MQKCLQIFIKANLLSFNISCSREIFVISLYLLWYQYTILEPQEYATRSFMLSS
jgi:hypothetical protein